MSTEYCKIVRKAEFFESNDYGINYTIENETIRLYNGVDFMTASILDLVSYNKIINLLDIPKDVEFNILDTILDDVNRCYKFMELN